MSGLATMQFDTSVFEEVGSGRLMMNSMTVNAVHIHAPGSPEYDDQKPVHFFVSGLRYLFVAKITADKARITVRDGVTGTRLSVILPTNQSELLEAIDTMARDFEDRLDMTEASA